MSRISPDCSVLECGHCEDPNCSHFCHTPLNKKQNPLNKELVISQKLKDKCYHKDQVTFNEEGQIICSACTTSLFWVQPKQLTDIYEVWKNGREKNRSL